MKEWELLGFMVIYGLCFVIASKSLTKYFQEIGLPFSVPCGTMLGLIITFGMFFIIKAFTGLMTP